MNSPNTVNPEYKSSTVDVAELEKLARAAKDDIEFCKCSWYTSASLHSGDYGVLEDHYDYVAAANPAAILELIDSHRKLSDLLSRAFGAIIRDSDGKLLSEAMSALNKANGEINE